MWITRVAFDTLNAERIKKSEEARVLAHQNSNLTITLDWMRHRVQQLEQERAHLLFQYMGIKVQVPTIVAPEPSQDDVLGGANLFQDVGDEVAKRLHIEWDDTGIVKQ